MTSSLLPTYARYPLAFASGEGVWLTTTDGERYLDLGGGIAVASLGYSHPHLVAALTAQARQLWHTSNLFQIPQAERLAERLTAASFADYVFFTNSGAEALEGAIKTARKYHAAAGHPERFHIITFDGAFHGRTIATIAAGGNQKYIEGFGPKAPGFDKVPFGDLDAVRAAIGPQTAAILIEPIQGEGGIRVPPASFLPALRALCDEHGLLLIADEVQSRRRPHRQALRLRMGGDRARHHGDRQGHRRRLPARRVSRHRRRPARAWCWARTARRSAAIRWRRPSAMPCSTSSSRPASSTRSAPRAFHAAPRCRSSPTSTPT